MFSCQVSNVLLLSSLHHIPHLFAWRMSPLVSMSREAGVRNLKKLLEKIYRKAALKLVKRGVQGPPKAEVVADAAPDKQSPGARRVAACAWDSRSDSNAQVSLHGITLSMVSYIPILQCSVA